MSATETILWIVLIVILMVLLLSYRKKSNAKLAAKLNDLLKAGDYQGLRKLTMKHLILWGSILLLSVVLFLIDWFSGESKSFRGIIVVAVTGYKFFIVLREYLAYGKAEKMFGFALTDKERSEMWEIEDDAMLVNEISDRVFRKSWNNYKMELLTKPERTVFVIDTLYEEVYNGGFSQFFFNTRNAFNDEIVDACRMIGAKETANICANALKIVNQGLSEDETDNLLDKECDTPFYNMEESPAFLCAAYARKNKHLILQSQA